ncbi:MAG: cupin domain-containing protein [Rubrobacter sp.]|jgi:uncharacterized cupin superfamily protein|nr:cupin domain-containing protein [Rubrobacter sp.]
MTEERKFIVRAEEAEESAADFSHPWNPNSEVRGVRFSSMVGFSRVGVSRVRVPPGKESFAYHSHRREEEWVFILSGRGLAEIDDEEYEVGPGDFMGFPAPQPPHHLKNASDTEDLVYLMGGEALDMDIADFPRLGKRMVRSGEDVQIYNVSDAKEFGPLDE